MNNYQLTINNYPFYKDSGVEWLGDVPEHWKEGRIKDFILSDIKTITPPNLSNLDMVEFVPMTNVDEKLGKIKEFNFVQLKDVSTGYTKFKNDDVIFAKITPCMENGNVAIVSGLKHNIGFGSTEFMVFRPTKKISSKYLHYFLHSFLFRKNAEPFMKGTAGQKRITSLYMATHYLALPLLSEQKAIADYLDTKTAQIDHKIDLLSQKAKLYSNLKQSLINETVTRGLDKSLPMKDSGIEWIGEIPEHWEVKKIKCICQEIISGPFGSSLTKDIYKKEGYKIYGQEQVIANDFSIGDYYISEEKYKEMVRYTVHSGDVLVSCVGTFGKIAVVPDRVEKGIINPRLIKLDLNKKLVIPSYFGILLASEISFSQIEKLSRGTTMGVVNIRILSDIELPIPPLSEQKAIADYLDTKTAQIDQIIQTINAQIEKLKELRKTLINDVVTGKIKVIE
jgi:type I restriction enzyme S subunit